MPHYEKKSAVKPKWFDLEKYKSMNNSDFDQWADNLIIRLDLLSMLDIKFKLNSGFEEIENDIESSIINCQRNGFILSPENEHLKEMIDVSPLINDLTIGDVKTGLLRSGQEAMPKILSSLEPLDYSNGIYEQMNAENKREYNSEKSEINRIKLNDSFHYLNYVSVDLSSSIPDIMEEFKTWVIKKKKECGDIPRKNITVEDIRMWRDSRIMPYLDLVCWYRQQEKKMPIDFIAGNWIFPEEHLNGESLLRDKTKNIFKKITSRQFKVYLFGQMAKNKDISKKK